MKKFVCVLCVCALALCAACSGKLVEAPPIVDPTPPVTIHEIAETISEVVEVAPVRLVMPDAPFAVGQDIEYSYVINSDELVRITDIPHLERETENGWRAVQFAESVGFCGTPNHYPAAEGEIWINSTLDVTYLYGAPLEAGRYRLSFNVVDEDYLTFEVIQAEFEIV